MLLLAAADLVRSNICSFERPAKTHSVASGKQEGPSVQRED